MDSHVEKSVRFWVAVVVFSFVLTAGGYALGKFHASGQGFREVAEDACDEVMHEDIATEVDQLTPKANTFSVQQAVTNSPGHYSSHCTVEAENVLSLVLTVEFTGFANFEEWSKEVQGGLIQDEGKERMSVAGGGWSTPSAVGVYVPCTISDTNEAGEARGGLSVRVMTHVEGDHRTELETIAKLAAKESASLSGPCKSVG